MGQEVFVVTIACELVTRHHSDCFHFSNSLSDQARDLRVYGKVRSIKLDDEILRFQIVPMSQRLEVTELFV